MPPVRKGKVSGMERFGPRHARGARRSPIRYVRGGLAALLAVVVLMIAAPANATSPAPVGLGTAGNFGVLAGSTVTNSGPTVVNGDLGVSPGSAVTGFPPGVVNGTIHKADAVAAQAQVDLTAAYNDAAGRACDTDLTGQDLGGLTLVPGVYCFDTSAQLTGTLTLDAQGTQGAVFIFQIGSTLTTASGSSVALINGASPCNVFWQVGSSATLGTTTSFVGNILALTSISANTGATIDGRFLARNGAVTLLSNTISICTTQPPPASIGVSKVADDAQIGVGSPMGFLITVSSNGPGTANNVTVNDPLPTAPGMFWTIDGGTGAAQCSIVNQVLKCNFGSMASGTSLTVHVSSPTGPRAAGRHTNTVSVTSSNGGFDQDTSTVRVRCPLDVTEGPDANQVTVGHRMGFWMSIVSRVTTATKVHLQGSLPAGSWTVDPSSSSGCSISGTTLSCTLGKMVTGGSRHVHVTAIAKNKGPATLNVAVTFYYKQWFQHSDTTQVKVV